jgi:hypothetical protein
VNGQLHAPSVLSPSKQPPVPFGYVTGGPQSRCERCGGDKNVDPAGNGTLAVDPVDVPTELSSYNAFDMHSEKTCLNAALSTTNPTCCPDANTGLPDGKPAATNRLSYGTV